MSDRIELSLLRDLPPKGRTLALIDVYLDKLKDIERILLELDFAIRLTKSIARELPGLSGITAETMKNAVLNADDGLTHATLIELSKLLNLRGALNVSLLTKMLEDPRSFLQIANEEAEALKASVEAFWTRVN